MKFQFIEAMNRELRKGALRRIRGFKKNAFHCNRGGFSLSILGAYRKSVEGFAPLGSKCGVYEARDLAYALKCVKKVGNELVLKENGA